VPAHRAHGIDLLQITIFIKGAGTIRVVFAAKLLKKLILHTLILLGLLCVNQVLPVPVPGQGRYALTRLRVPDLKCLVPASACYFCAVWAVNHRQDPAFAMR
jgi:hypothetical protein